MKIFKKYIFAVALLATTLMSSCLKDNETKYAGDFVEMDAAVYNANAAGTTYPMLTRLPQYGQVLLTTDPLISRTSGTVKFRVNLVGPQRSTPTTVGYTIVAAATTAIAGTHFTTGNSVTIPANSSFAEIEVQILNPGVASTTVRDLVLELTGAGDLPPSENEKRLGIRISQL